MRIKEADYLRAFAITTIVIWHCFVCPLTCWQLIDATTGSKIISVLGSVAIPDANMPLFTFLAGYIFMYSIGNKSTYGDFMSFFKNKFKRLVIPFLIIGTAVCATAPDRYLTDIPFGEGSHLWYCMMLFWCFIISWVSHIKGTRKTDAILYLGSVLFATYCGSVWSTPFNIPFGLDNTFFYINYFIGGMYLYSYRDKLKEKVNFKTIAMLAILYIIVCGMCLSHIPYLANALTIIKPSVYILTLLAIVVHATNTILAGEPNKAITVLCKYSFGIYVFHEWLSWDLYHFQPLYDVFIQAPILYAFIFTILDFIVSITLTHYCLKTKIGKFLLA